MVSMLNTKSLSIQIQTLVNKLDKRLFKQTINVDSKTFTFYTFKFYPRTLSRQMREDWAKIQAKVNSPFENGEVQYHLCDVGVAIWACADKFSGLPETRAQKILSDGSHVVKGKSQHYKQFWKQGILTQCYVIESNDEYEVELEVDKTPWAVDRQIDKIIASPVHWAVFIAALFCIIFIWFISAITTINISVAHLEEKIASSEVEMGAVLNQQVELQNRAGVISQLNQWRHRFLPFQVVFGELVKSVSAHTTWDATSIEWQANVLILELNSYNIDIASLVQVLENNKLINKAAVRPHTRENTWILEVTFNENAFS